MKIKSIYYHNPDACHLERMIVWIKKKGYRFISDKELFSILKNKQRISEKLVYLSFDDAWRSNLSFIPVIEKHKVPITIFVPIEPLYSGNYWWDYVGEDAENYKQLPFDMFCKELGKKKSEITVDRNCMTIDELMQLSSHPLVSLQSHTVNHPILTNIPDTDIEMEIIDGKKKLEKIIGREVCYFSYPNGSYSEREVNIVSKSFKMAFTTKIRHISTNDNLYELPRVGLTGSFYKDIVKFYGLWPIIRRTVYFLTRKESCKPQKEYGDA